MERVREIGARFAPAALIARGLIAALASVGLGLGAATLAGAGAPLRGLIALGAAALLGALALRRLRAAARARARVRARRRVREALSPLARSGWGLRAHVLWPRECLDFLLTAPDARLAFAICALDRAPSPRVLDGIQGASGWFSHAGEVCVAVCAVAGPEQATALASGVLIAGTDALAPALVEAHAAFLAATRGDAGP